MRKITFLTGLALGYVLGTRAGRERYEQLRKAARDISQTPSVQSATRNAKQAAGTAASKAADALAGRVSGRLPTAVTERVPYLRDRAAASAADSWDSSGD